MTPRFFGTDGIRARFGDEPLVESTVRRIGRTLAEHLAASTADPLVLLAGDTRASTRPLLDWASRGLLAGGARAFDLGVLPTPALARLVVERNANAGLVVSASHNPPEDNGIKLIGADGFKWPSASEHALEGRLEACADPGPGAPAPRDETAAEAYLTALVQLLGDGLPLRGLRVALDAANGAASALAGNLFARLGAEVELLFAEPDGLNINHGCGSTHPQALAARVGGGSFDLGFAFDGDADRALLVDETGRIRDGDAMLVLWARFLHQNGHLAPPRIVATSMSNLGLERALDTLGIRVERCEVGDRAVVDTLRAAGLRLGGEQSGHLVDLALSTTGDGLLTAATLSLVVARAGRPVSELLRDFHRYPQVLVNVPVRTKPPLESLPGVAAAARDVRERLAGDGRLVLRYSGTEPLARVMVEGPDELVVGALADALAVAIRRDIGTL